jgi:prevent-host-death family protein
MERVGVRELRQNLSVYLRRVKAGESLDVTERGKTVARLVPTGPGHMPDWLERMVAEGNAVPATRSISDLPPPDPSRPGEPSTAEVLDELREDRI